MTRQKRDFLIFHYQNPLLWEHINRFALEKARGGWKHYGVDMVIARARWETDVPTKGSKYKINNNHRCHYSRMWMLLHPEHKGFFRKRAIPDDFLPDKDYYGPPPPDDDNGQFLFKL